MKIRIVSAGPMVHETRVEDADTGEMIDGVIAVTWEAHVGGGFATATLTFDQVLIDGVSQIAEVYAKTSKQVREEAARAAPEDITIPRKQLAALLDEEPCRYDHDDNCQTHGVLAPEMCAHMELRNLLR